MPSAPALKQVGKLFYHVSLWESISRDSEFQVGVHILEISMSFLFV